MKTKTIIALDFKDLDSTKEFLSKFKDEQLFVKIGMELFYSEGPKIVEYIKDLGHDIFLDLKLMDIPNTVNKAMKNLAKLGVNLTNVHAVGGVEMMKAAKEGFGDNGLLIAVTYLTSINDNILKREILVDKTVKEAASLQAVHTFNAGLNGVVCSPFEAKSIKSDVITSATDECNPMAMEVYTKAKEFITVTPGIRPKGEDSGDQKRVATPFDAKELGSDFIVVGRPITQSSNPLEVYKTIKTDFLS